MTTVGEVIAALEEWYPARMAQDWDAVGLVVGDRRAEVSSILFTVDVTAAVVAEAVQRGATMIIAHHPLLLRGIHSVDVDHPKGRIVTELIKAGIALYVAHTNADLPDHGTVDSLASALGLRETKPLRPISTQPLDKIVTFVPAEHATSVLDALAAAGAGAIGNYDRCAFTIPGTGTFRPLDGASPFLGETNRIEEVDEVRLEMVLARSHRTAVVQALLAAHPYETPAYDLIELAPVDSHSGLGRVGTLDQPITLRAFAERVASVLPQTGGGIRVSGDPDRQVQRIAVQAGAGDNLLDAARLSGADVYLTSDLRHHPASEAREWAAAPALIDVPHWAAEWLWLPVVQGLLSERLGVDSTVSTLPTDPWNFRI